MTWMPTTASIVSIDRRVSVLDATARDLDPVGPGAPVDDLPGLHDQLRADWIVGDAADRRHRDLRTTATTCEHVMAVST